MTGFNTRLLPDTLRSATGNAAPPNFAAYEVLGGPLEVTPRIVKFTNNGTVDVFISWDGVNDHEVLPAGSFLLLDIAANKQQTNTLYIEKGIQFWVKSVDGSAGAASDVVYLSVYYA